MSWVNTWLMRFLISYVFVLVICLLAVCLCFCFVWAHGFCLSFLCAMCSCQFVLTAPILLLDNWFICPTCYSLPSSIAPFNISLCLQSRVGSFLYAVYSLCPALPCPGLPWPALPCPALPCPALPCPALPCPALPCPALPCPALPCPALSCPALSCPALPCPALPCPALPCPVLPCPALPCPALPCPASQFFTLRGSFYLFCLYYYYL